MFRILISVFSPPSYTYIASVRVGSQSAYHALGYPGLPHEELALVPGHGHQLGLQQDGGDGGEGGVGPAPASSPGVAPVAVVSGGLWPAGRPDQSRGTDPQHLRLGGGAELQDCHVVIVAGT